jgi:hypothetical protein
VPGEETCGDGTDDDCDGIADEDCCDDQTLNGDESDVDCGGSCPACGDGQTCDDDDDCQSGFCDQGTCQSDLPASCLEIAMEDPFAMDGFYSIRLDGRSATVYCDMSTDGGGWTLVLLNSPYATHPKPSFAEAVSENNITGSMTSLMDFDQLLGVGHWSGLGTQLRVEQGDNPGSLSHQVVYDFSVDPGNAYALQLSNEQVRIHLAGSASPGLFTTHNGQPLSTYDADNDGSTGNCSSSNSNSPWWFVDCWSGSFWGGGDSGGGPYENRPYWSGNGTEKFDWGAFWIR